MRKKELPLLRGSERSDFKKCQWMWWYTWRMGYASAGLKANALWFGGGIHLALAGYYQPQGKGPMRGFKRGPDPVETWDKFIKNERPRFFRVDEPGEMEEKEWIQLEVLGRSMLEGYVDYYEGDPSWEFLAPEMPFAVLVPDAEGTPIADLRGTWDGAYRDHDNEAEVRLLETKSAAVISTRHLILDPQAGGYDLVADTMMHDLGIIPPSESVRYIVYNFLRKAIPKEDERPLNSEGLRLNKDGTVSKRQKLQADIYARHLVERSPAEKRSVLEGIVNEVKQMNLIREGVVGPTKNPGFLGDNCRGCALAEMCELHEQGGDYQEFADEFLIQRDPYADHRAGAKSSKFL